MTTRVTIDAHAGWDVLVVEIQGEPSYPKRVKETIVPANQQVDFYIHSGNRIVAVEELPK